MAGLRSWFGALLALGCFLAVRRYTAGLAAPAFIASILAIVYAWFVILRVPYLRKPFEEAAAARTAKKAESTDAAKAPADAPQSAQAVLSPVTPLEPLAAGRSVPEPKASRVAGDEPSVAALSSTVSAAAPQDLPVTPPEKEPAPGASSDIEGKRTEQAPKPLAPATIVAPPSPVEASGQNAPPDVPVGVGSDEDSEEEYQADEKKRIPRGEEPKVEEEDFADPVRAHELRLQGNELFKSGKLHDAREAYSEALHVSPADDKKGRAALFCNRAACFLKMSRWEQVVSDCNQAISLDPEYSRAYARRSIAQENLQKWHDASEDLKKAIELDPSLKSQEFKRQAFLEARAQQQFEKDKEEMMSKLKDLGNTVLGKFGMSLDNFKMEQDPNTGSYSMKYGS